MGGSGSDTLVGGAGNDTFDYSQNNNAQPVNVDLTGANTSDDGLGGNDTVTGFETVLSGSGNDTITGSKGGQSRTPSNPKQDWNTVSYTWSKDEAIQAELGGS